MLKFCELNSRIKNNSSSFSMIRNPRNFLKDWKRGIFKTAKMRSYSPALTAEVAKQLDIEFDQLFSTETVYDQLDDRISKTREKKKSLLMVLTMPTIPLHNNAAELAARAKVRKRDVSLQTVTDKGTKANDTFMTIVQTAKKLGVSAYDYIFDRVSNKFEMLSLAQLIREKSALKDEGVST